MMAVPPSWMSPSEIQGGFSPLDVEEDYTMLEEGRSASRHRLLFNMLALFPDEMIDDLVSTERMDFYLDKTGSISSVHLRDKVQRYILSSDAERVRVEYFHELIEWTMATDEAEGVAAAPLQQAASSPHAMLNEAEGVAVAQDDWGVPLASLQQASQFPPAMRDGAAMEDEGVAAAPLQQAASSPHAMLNEEPMDEAEGVAVAQDDLGVPLASLQQALQAMDEVEGVAAAPLQQAASSPHVKRMRTSDEAADAGDEDEGGAAARPGGISWQGASERGQIFDKESPQPSHVQPPSHEAEAEANVKAEAGPAASVAEAKSEVAPEHLIESSQPSHEQPPSHEAEAEANVKAEAGPAASGVRVKEELYDTDAQGEAGSAYKRTSAALGAGEMGPTNLETSDSSDHHHAGFITKSIDTLMALKAKDCTEPSVAAQPSNRTPGDLKWLQAHHEATNLKGSPSKWQLHLMEFQVTGYFEQELLAGVGPVRSGSPMLLASSPVCVFKEGTTKLRSQVTSSLPGSLININLLSTSIPAVKQAMQASVQKLDFEEVMLKDVGSHCYQVVTFVQLFTHVVTFEEDEQWLLTNHPKLVPLLTKPAALLLGFNKPRKLLLAMVEDLLPVEKKPSQALIVKEGNKAIRTMLLNMVDEEREKGVSDITYKMLFEAHVQPPNPTARWRPRQTLMAKLALLASIPWGIMEHAVCVTSMTAGTSSDDTSPANARSSKGRVTSALQSSSSSVGSTSTYFPLHRRGSNKGHSLPIDDQAALSFDDLADLSDDLGLSPSGNLMDSDLLKHVKKVIQRTFMTLKKGDYKTEEAASKALQGSTSCLLNNTIVPKLKAMSLEIKATRNMTKGRLEEIKDQASFYAQSAADAIDTMHSATKDLTPSYNPQAKRVQGNIRQCRDAVHDAADEALKALEALEAEKAQKALDAQKPKAPKRPKSESESAGSRLHPTAMAVDTPLAPTAQLRTIPAEPRDSAEKAAELATERKAKEKAQEELTRLKHQLDRKEEAEKFSAKHSTEMEKMRATMMAQNEQLRSKLAETEKTLARNEGSQETEAKLKAELDQLKGALGDTRVETAYFKGAIIGSMGGLSGAGPSGAGLNPGNHLASLMMPQAQPPNRPSLMPPPSNRPSLMPPPPTPPNQPLQLQHRGQESKVRPDLQPLIEELTQAEGKAAHPPPNTVPPNYVDAKACCDWKEALTKLDVSIASLEAIREEQANARKYGEAEATHGELLRLEEKLAVDMSTARQWLDGLPR